MPYTMRKVRNKNCYRVSKKVRVNKKTGKTAKRRVFSKCATRENAVKQMKLLRALEFNKDFVPNAVRK
uniref:Uncharacterized protein n=1 Tax=viral metagenome TaxID=1070528 RepID=A0A6C0KMA6_9ZZZZ